MTRKISLIILLAGIIGLVSAQSAGAVCGDGTPDPGEQCDLGAGNGTPGSCCTSLCEFRAVGLVCRAAAGPCDVAETCTGADGNCPADAFQSSNFQCRSEAGACDMAETCSGTGPACPSDAFRPAGTVCRAPAGSCDVTENCDGASPACPPDAFEPSTTVCRPATGACDVSESCTGTGPSCPADAVQPNGEVCRPGTGTCDPAEVCDGVTVACPPDTFAPDGTACNDGSACTDNDACFRGACVGTTNVDACLDDFFCYRTRASAGEPKFTPFTVHLVDQFDDLHFDVLKPKLLCPPADKNSQGIIDSATHLRAYAIRAVRGTPRYSPRTNILVTNQLGDIRVNTIRPDLLLVPAAKSLTAPPSPPDPGSSVDHYKCYKVRVTPGTPSFQLRVFVTVADQFTPLKTIRLIRPKHLCTPVSKNDEVVKNATVHLMCYFASGRPRTPTTTGVFVRDQFGPARVDRLSETELCIPSQKTP